MEIQKERDGWDSGREGGRGGGTPTDGGGGSEEERESAVSLSLVLQRLHLVNDNSSFL